MTSSKQSGSVAGAAAWRRRPQAWPSVTWLPLKILSLCKSGFPSCQTAGIFGGGLSAAYFLIRRLSPKALGCLDGLILMIASPRASFCSLALRVASLARNVSAQHVRCGDTCGNKSSKWGVGKLPSYELSPDGRRDPFTISGQRKALAERQARLLGVILDVRQFSRTPILVCFFASRFVLLRSLMADKKRRKGRTMAFTLLVNRQVNQHT